MTHEGMVFRYWEGDGMGYLKTRDGNVYTFRDRVIEGKVANGDVVEFDVKGGVAVRGVVVKK